MEVTVMQETILPKLEVRNLRFGTDAGEVPRHWHGGRKSVTTFFDNLSVFFPAGERFFIDAVKAHRHLVADERLLKDVALFCAQEGIHGREHIRYNEMLEKQGYPALELDAKVERILRRVRRVLPKRRQLAVTCALEHFTALMAHYILSDPRLLEGADPIMTSLWRWHAAEENEHRAVAYDVYRAARGPYLERASTMLVTTMIFWALVIQHQAKMMKTDGTQWSFDEWRALFVYLFIEPGGMPQLWRRWLDYFHPRFHPWDHDNSELLEEWKSEYARARNGAVST
jgi:uncharacterized protein